MGVVHDEPVTGELRSGHSYSMHPLPALALPTIRKRPLPIAMDLSIGSIGPNSLSATSQPMIVTGRSLAISTGLIRRPRSTS